VVTIIYATTVQLIYIQVRCESRRMGRERQTLL